MRKLMNPGPTDLPTSLGLLLIRLAAGGMMIYGHGWGKLMAFSKKAPKFPDPLGIGNELSMMAAIAGEVLFPALLIIGVFTRLAAVPAAFTMVVAAFIVHGDDPFAKQEMALLYLTAFLTLIMTGAGRFSVDGTVG